MTWTAAGTPTWLFADSFGSSSATLPVNNVTTGNLLLNVLDMYGIHKDQQGDSTGRLTKL